MTSDALGGRSGGAEGRPASACKSIEVVAGVDITRRGNEPDRSTIDQAMEEYRAILAMLVRL